MDIFSFFLMTPNCPKETDKYLFDKMHPIVAFLENTRKPLNKYIAEKEASDPGEAGQIFSVFDSLAVSLIVPMISNSRLIGMIALGQKKSGELFVHEDLELLTTIANQSVTSLENAKSYEEIEKLNRDLEKKVEERTAALRQGHGRDGEDAEAVNSIGEPCRHRTIGCGHGT